MANSINLNGYTITLVNVDNSECPYRQTWTYRITQTNRSFDKIDSWSLNLAPEHKVVSNENETNIGISTVEFNDASCLNKEDNIFKWKINNEEFLTGMFSITLEGCWRESVIQVTLQSGKNCLIGTIDGPGCSCHCPTTTTTASTSTTTTCTTTKTATTTTTSSTSSVTTTTSAPIRGVKIF